MSNKVYQAYIAPGYFARSAFLKKKRGGVMNREERIHDVCCPVKVINKNCSLREKMGGFSNLKMREISSFIYVPFFLNR